MDILMEGYKLKFVLLMCFGDLITRSDIEQLLSQILVRVYLEIVSLLWNESSTVQSPIPLS